MFKLAELFVPIEATLDGLDKGLRDAESRLTSASEKMGAKAAVGIGQSAVAGLGTSLAGIGIVVGRSFSAALVPLQAQMANTGRIIRSAALQGGGSLAHLSGQLGMVARHMDNIAGSNFDRALSKRLKEVRNPVWRGWLKGVQVLRGVQNQAEFTRATLSRATAAANGLNPFRRLGRSGPGGMRLPGVMSPSSAKWGDVPNSGTSGHPSSGGPSGGAAAAGARAATSGGAAMAPLLAVAAGAAASFKLAKLASSQTEAINLMEVTFGSASRKVEADIDGLVQKFGESKTELLDLTSGIGSIFQGANMGASAVASLSSEFAKLSLDMGSLRNLETAEVLAKVKAGLVGEMEPLRSLGITINETMVANEAYRLGLAAVGDDVDESGKVMARSSLIMKKMQVAAGDASKTHHEFAGQLREFYGQVANLGAAIGQQLEPAWTGILTTANMAVRSMIQGVNDLAFVWNNLGLYVRKAEVHFEGAFSLITAGFGHLGKVASVFTDWFKSNWLSIFIDASRGASVGLANIMSNVDRFLGWFSKNWKSIFQDAFDGTIAALGNLGKNFMDFGKAAYDWIAGGFRKPFVFSMTPVMQGFSAKTEAMPEMTPLLQGFNALTEALKLPEFGPELQKVLDKFGLDLDQVNGAIKAAADAAKNPGNLGVDAAKAASDAMGRKSKEKKSAEFVGIEDFAKRIQSGALDKDRTAKDHLAIAKDALEVQKQIAKNTGKPQAAIAK